MPVLDPDLEERAQECIKDAESGQDDADKTRIQALVGMMNSYFNDGDVDRARALQEELRKSYLQLPVSSVNARCYAEKELKQPRQWGWYAFIKWRYFLALAVGVLAVLIILYVILKVYRSARNAVRLVLFTRKTKWFVQSIQDKQEQAAAGAVMDALSIQGNALLREPFVPPALLLVPPGFGSRQGLWWVFFRRRNGLGIEVLPRVNMERHIFIFDEALEEINIKVAGQEISGLVAVARNISRWFNKNSPTVQGAVLRIAPSEASISWAVRLTATSGPRWVKGLRKDGLKTFTISVYSSTEEEEFVDAVGLAAQRSAFKLFYRLAELSWLSVKWRTGVLR